MNHLRYLLFSKSIASNKVITRYGVTKLELLVAFIATALLLQLLIPLLNSNRETVRRQECLRNFQRISQSIHSYYDSNRMLPPASNWDSDGLDLEELLRSARPIEVTRKNWVQLCLPYMDANILADKFSPSKSITHDENKAARSTEYQRMKCPSDSYNGAKNHYRLELLDGKHISFSRGNYAINGGSHYINDAPGWLSNPRPNGVSHTYNLQNRTFQIYGNGIAGINKSFSFSDFSNGLSTTVAVNEIRAGIHPLDPRGVWSLGQIGGSITWAHGVNGDAYGPNNQIANSDDIQGCMDLHKVLGKTFLEAANMPCCNSCEINNQAGSRSMHPGGANILMMDGSSYFITDDVDIGIWHVMHSRLTPEDILSEGFEQKLVNKSENSNIQRKINADESSTTSAIEQQNLRSRFENSLGMNFVSLPSGSFLMGVRSLGMVGPHPKEAVAHKVTITKPFYIGVHEVTQWQFTKVMGKNPSWHAIGGLQEKSIAGKDTSNYPVENVTWYEAHEFCQKLSSLPEEQMAGRSYRLPTEAEWEYSCRSGSSEAYRFNPEWLDDDASGEIAGKNWIEPPIPTSPVGSYPANDFGLHDMRGNVYEWCNDWFSLDYYSLSPIENPQGPSQGYLRVVRGWDWLFTGPACVLNISLPPWKSSPFIGFRVVCVHTPK